LGSPTISSAYGTAGYTPYCGTAICLVMNLTALTTVADGAILTLPVSFASTAALGTQTLAITGVAAATSAGLNVNGMGSGTAYTIKVYSPCDFQQTGTVNVADVQSMIAAILTGGTCPVSASNGGCSLTNVEYEIAALLGGACKIP
jgi:hypothetical protein